MSSYRFKSTTEIKQCIKSKQTVILRIKQIYGSHFPELTSVISDDMLYCKVIDKMGLRSNAETTDFSNILNKEMESSVISFSKRSMGIDLDQNDLCAIQTLCKQVIKVLEICAKFFDETTKKIAPHLSLLFGTNVAIKIALKAKFDDKDNFSFEFLKFSNDDTKMLIDGYFGNKNIPKLIKTLCVFYCDDTMLYHRLFNYWDIENAGYLSKKQVFELFMCFGIPKDSFEIIWTDVSTILKDVTGIWRLDSLICGMKYLSLMLNGFEQTLIFRNLCQKIKKTTILVPFQPDFYQDILVSDVMWTSFVTFASKTITE